MIKDKTIDQALIELKRTEKALMELRAERKAEKKYCPLRTCTYSFEKLLTTETACKGCGTRLAVSVSGPMRHAAVKRASLDLTRKLADLRAGR